MNRTKIQEKNLYLKVKEICQSGDVVLFDAEEVLDWGRPIVKPKGIEITARIPKTHDGLKSYFYPWEDISFLCHQGFVWHKIKGPIAEIKQQTIYKIRIGPVPIITWREVYIGDPIRMAGRFEPIGSGLLVKQSGGAQGIVMPQTLLLQG